MGIAGQPVQVGGREQPKLIRWRYRPRADLEAGAIRAALAILGTAPEARPHTKRMLNQQYAAIDYETMFASLAYGREPREGMAAFLEKREPDWAAAAGLR